MLGRVCVCVCVCGVQVCSATFITVQCGKSSKAIAPAVLDAIACFFLLLDFRRTEMVAAAVLDSIGQKQ